MLHMEYRYLLMYLLLQLLQVIITMIVFFVKQAY